MKKAVCIVKNFDARIFRVELRPKNDRSKVIIHTSMWSEEKEKNVLTDIWLENVAAVEFRINCFDNMIGAEAFGLYEIDDPGFMDAVVCHNYERRKEVYLFEGDYDYDLNEKEDMLNVFDVRKVYEKNKAEYKAYVQNVDGGVYIIISKNWLLKEKE